MNSFVFLIVMVLLVFYFSIQTWSLTRTKDCQTTWYSKIADTVGVGGLIASVFGLIIGLLMVSSTIVQPLLVIFSGLALAFIFGMMVWSTHECGKGKTETAGRISTAVVYIADSVGIIGGLALVALGVLLYFPAGQAYLKGLRVVQRGAGKLEGMASKFGQQAGQIGSQVQRFADQVGGIANPKTNVLFY